jgi:hypothetical protein
MNKKIEVYNKQKKFIGFLTKNKKGYRLGNIPVTHEALNIKSLEILDIYYNIYNELYL